MLPPIWLLICIIGLTLLSETIYSPSLPEIANALNITETTAEHTLAIYLFAFALGTLFWGILSDRMGRKPCLIIGLCIFSFGSLGCYFSHHIIFLMLSRFIQGFGGSVSSVLGQSISRDKYHGPMLGKIYSSIGIAISIFPAIGPILGGVIAYLFDWRNIFLFLISFAGSLILLIWYRLPETLEKSKRIYKPILPIALDLMLNKKVVGFIIIVAACNGITFSYISEAPFYLIKALKLDPVIYGFTFIPISLSSIFGGIYSKHLNDSMSQIRIIQKGLFIMLATSGCSFGLIMIHEYFISFENLIIISLTVFARIIIVFGMSMVMANSLSLALSDYKDNIGTASSLFGFAYCILISLFNFGMGWLHNGGLIVMPLYFFIITIGMTLVSNCMILKNNDMQLNAIKS